MAEPTLEALLNTLRHDIHWTCLSSQERNRIADATAALGIGKDAERWRLCQSLDPEGIRYSEGEWGVSVNCELHTGRTINEAIDAALAAAPASPDGRFERYAWHDDDCTAVRRGGELYNPPRPCSCGFKP